MSNDVESFPSLLVRGEGGWGGGTRARECVFKISKIKSWQRKACKVIREGSGALRVVICKFCIDSVPELAGIKSKYVGGCGFVAF